MVTSRVTASWECDCDRDLESSHGKDLEECSEHKLSVSRDGLGLLLLPSSLFSLHSSTLSPTSQPDCQPGAYEPPFPFPDLVMLLGDGRSRSPIFTQGVAEHHQLPSSRTEANTRLLDG